MGFSRQEYWSGLPFPSPGDLSNPGIKPGSPALRADSLPSEPSGKYCYGHFTDEKLKLREVKQPAYSHIAYAEVTCLSDSKARALNHDTRTSRI